MQRIVIVGAGLAGHRAAVTLQERGFNGQVEVVGDEADFPYDRPPLSKQVLAGTMTVEQLRFPVEDLSVTWTLGSGAVGLDTTDRQVLLADGSQVPYDGLIVATGRRARPWTGPSPRSGVHTLRSIQDTVGFASDLASERRVVIIGAGFVGCEVAATLRGLGVESVTVVDVAPYPMPVTGPEVGQRALSLHVANGVQFRLGVGVTSIDGESTVESVTLTSGERVPADLVLVSMGSVPNTEWLANADVRLADGGTVVCDSFCRVLNAAGEPHPDIVAAGDVASLPLRHSDDPVCIEHWSNARDMAATGVATLLGGEAGSAAMDAVPTFWSDQYDVKIKSAGFLRAADRFEVVHEDPVKNSLVVEARRAGEVVGAVVFNRNRAIVDYQRSLAAARTQ